MMDSFSNVFQIHNLKAVVLPGRGVRKEFQQYYDTLYQTWKSVWTQTLHELDGSGQLQSDNFTRQDYHLSLFHGPRCVSSISFRRINLHVEADLEDSWLKIWPSDLLHNFSQSMINGLMVSWFFVDPEYRKAQSNSHLSKFEVSKRLTELISFFLLEVRADIAFAGVRNNRSVNTLFSPSGCKVIVPKVLNHGVEVDLVTWLPADVENAISKFTNESFELWKNRLAFHDGGLPLITEHRTLSSPDPRR